MQERLIIVTDDAWRAIHDFPGADIRATAASLLHLAEMHRGARVAIVTYRAVPELHPVHAATMLARAGMIEIDEPEKPLG